MTAVFVVVHLHPDDQWEIQGVFSTKEGAAAICQTEADSVVRFELDADCTEERTFEVTHPTVSPEPALVTC